MYFMLSSLHCCLFQTEYPSRQYMGLNLVTYIRLTSPFLFPAATDSTDREADRINKSQSAPDKDGQEPFLARLSLL